MKISRAIIFQEHDQEDQEFLVSIKKAAEVSSAFIRPEYRGDLYKILKKDYPLSLVDIENANSVINLAIEAINKIIVENMKSPGGSTVNRTLEYYKALWGEVSTGMSKVLVFMKNSKELF